VSAIKAKITEDVKSAMKAKEQAKLDALRFLQAAIKYKEIELRPESIKDEDVLGVIRKLAKQRKESIEQFGQAGRKDLVDKETAELAFLESYLPQSADRATTEKVVGEVIAALNASSIKDMGAVMKESISRLAGAADNKLLSEIVRARLS
jgi:uncharacterized protein YqeY